MTAPGGAGEIVDLLKLSAMRTDSQQAKPRSTVTHQVPQERYQNPKRRDTPGRYMRTGVGIHPREKGSDDWQAVRRKSSGCYVGRNSQQMPKQAPQQLAMMESSDMAEFKKRWSL